jgi:hypothetical protein
MHLYRDDCNILCRRHDGMVAKAERADRLIRNRFCDLD